MERRYTVWDVFTSQPLSGNPLAVVLDAQDLSSFDMQAIAKEFNLSETVFILPPTQPAHTARIRIFTPQIELPFAGHPTIGAAIELANERIEAGDVDALIVLEEEVGSVRVGVLGRKEAAPYAEFDVPVLPKELGPPPPDDRIAAALGLAPNEIGFANHKACVFDAGSAFTFVPVRDLGVIGRAQVVHQHWNEAFDNSASKAFLYCRETVRHQATFHARMFAPGVGVPEDPATGSGAAAFAEIPLRYDQIPEGLSEIVIEQGVEIGRPSEIKLEIEVQQRALKRVRIGGFARRVMKGTLFF